MTLFTLAALAAGLAVAPSEAEAAAPAMPVPALAAAPAAAEAAEEAPAPQRGGIGGPIEPIEFDVSAILVEGRKADESRWAGAVDPALARRYGPREPSRYNQITIPF